MYCINVNLSEDFTPTTMIANLCGCSMNLVTNRVTYSNPVLGIARTVHTFITARSLSKKIDKEIAEVYEKYKDYETEYETIETECEVIS